MNAEKIGMVADRIERLAPGQFDMDEWRAANGTDRGCIAYWTLRELRPGELETRAVSASLSREAQEELELDGDGPLRSSTGWAGRGRPGW